MAGLDIPLTEIVYTNAQVMADEYGMKIKMTHPPLKKKTNLPMLDKLIVNMCLECKKPIPLRDFKAFCWTTLAQIDDEDLEDEPITTVSDSRSMCCPNFFLPENDEHDEVFREIDLKYAENSRRWTEDGVTEYDFSSVVYPTHAGNFRLTYSMRFHIPEENKTYVWANDYDNDAIVTVTQANSTNLWNEEPSSAQITQNMYLGNYLAVLGADDEGFDAVLNLDESTQEKMDHMVTKILRAYHLSDVDPGAGNEISSDQIQNIVKWLWNAYPKFKKILVGDHEGIGGAGSAMTSYIFANNPNLTFEEAYKYVCKRKFVYCHKGLKYILNKAYPRD
ncbi:uncharacterized protein LOC131940798 [Physella acuta]|uniref:uncharacterized protein LOC131940798 n=1 Tax=Physella acuta TaxID=109671 RepID=UPI0027DB9608|nr:uncharacterized protein LOC131940798 [Physella acuta]